MLRSYASYLDFLETAKYHYTALHDQYSNERVLRQFEQHCGPFNTTTQPIVFLLDFSQKKYLAMSPSIQPLLGYSASYVMDGGVELVLQKYHPIDGKIYFGDIFFKNLEFLRNQPLETHHEICFSYNYRFKIKSGEYRTMLQRFRIIQSAPDGTPLMMLAFLTDITHFKNDGKISHTIERMIGAVPELLYKRVYFAGEEMALSTRETEVLQWISEGLSSKQIADKLRLSIYTVHNHRKNILEKTNCHNMAEVLRYVIEKGQL